MYSRDELFLRSLDVILVFILLVDPNSGNKHQYNPLVSAETVCHSSTYIILLSLNVYSHGCNFHKASFVFGNS